MGKPRTSQTSQHLSACSIRTMDGRNFVIVCTPFLQHPRITYPSAICLSSFSPPGNATAEDCMHFDVHDRHETLLHRAGDKCLQRDKSGESQGAHTRRFHRVHPCPVSCGFTRTCMRFPADRMRFCPWLPVSVNHVRLVPCT